MGFVFLFLAYRLHLSSPINSQPSNSLAATSSIKSETHPVAATAPPLPGRGIIDSDSAETKNKSANIFDVGEEISAPEDIYYPVVKVVDGDTIDIAINGKTERIRLIGINTPEVVDPRKPVECFGRQASDNAHKLLDGAKVKIAADPSQDDQDKYGRLLRYVWRQDGFFYNLAAIRDGFAYEYTYNIPYQYQTEFKAAQKYARDNKLGLWADNACGTDSFNPLTSASPAAAPNPECVIKGNISSSGEKIYHLPGCDYYNQTVIDESKGEKWFCTEAEAVAAGWRKAKNCL